MTCKQCGTRARAFTRSLTYTLHTSSTTSFEHKIINFFFCYRKQPGTGKNKIWGTAGICYLKLNVQNRQTNTHHSLDTNRENRIPVYTDIYKYIESIYPIISNNNKRKMWMRGRLNYCLAMKTTEQKKKDRKILFERFDRWWIRCVFHERKINKKFSREQARNYEPFKIKGDYIRLFTYHSHSALSI